MAGAQRREGGGQRDGGEHQPEPGQQGGGACCAGRERGQRDHARSEDGPYVERDAMDAGRRPAGGVSTGFAAAVATFRALLAWTARPVAGVPPCDRILP